MTRLNDDKMVCPFAGLKSSDPSLYATLNSEPRSPAETNGPSGSTYVPSGGIVAEPQGLVAVWQCILVFGVASIVGYF